MSKISKSVKRYNYKINIAGTDCSYIGSSNSCENRLKVHKDFVKCMFHKSLDENGQINIDKKIDLYKVPTRTIRGNGLCYVLYLTYIEKMNLEIQHFLDNLDNIINGILHLQVISTTNGNSRKGEQQLINKNRMNVVNKNRACVKYASKKFDMRKTYEQRCQNAADKLYNYLQLMREITDLLNINQPEGETN